MILLFALLQSAPAQAPAAAVTPVSQRFSILLPECRTPAANDDIVVCANGPNGQRLPLPDERASPDGRGANRERTGAKALALQSTPCAATQGGCQVGVNVLGPPVMLVRLLTKVINPRNDCCAPGEATDPVALARDGVRGIGRMFARKPDKSNRVAIPLDDPVPAAAAGP